MYFVFVIIDAVTIATVHTVIKTFLYKVNNEYIHDINSKYNAQIYVYPKPAGSHPLL